jgi:hypothetical protein
MAVARGGIEEGVWDWRHRSMQKGRVSGENSPEPMLSEREWLILARFAVKKRDEVCPSALQSELGGFSATIR